MAQRDVLLAEWRTRLAECERRLSCTLPMEPRWAWAWRIQARILRFLLVRYAPAEMADSFSERATDAAMAGEPRASSRGYFAADSAGGGAPPKSAERIRQTLSAVHDVNESVREVTGGPLHDGLSLEETILAGIVDAALADTAHQKLTDAGIWHRSEGRRDHVGMWVRRRDYGQARHFIEPFADPPIAKLKRAIATCMISGGIVAGLAQLSWRGWSAVVSQSELSQQAGEIVPAAGFCVGLILGILLVLQSRERR